MKRAELEQLARLSRFLVAKTVHESGAGHVGGSLSAIELLIALYFGVMRIRPEQPDWPERDHFVLSKGHAAVGFYTILALRGFFPVSELATFDHGGSRLQGHPDMTLLPGLDASTGSLGQGLSFGLGLALAARTLDKVFHTFVLLGDGELQEGMVWEAVHVARRYRLGRLTAIVDWNGLQQYGWPGSGRGDRADPWENFSPSRLFEAFGWRVEEIDGHDFDAILPSLQRAKEQPQEAPPTALIVRTVKGKGLSFTEGRHAWHSRVPTAEDVARAREELGVSFEEVGE